MALVNDSDKVSTFFENPARLNILEMITKSVKDRSELIVLSGKSGTGKSVLMDRVINSLHDEILPLIFWHQSSTFEEMLTEIFEQINFIDSNSQNALVEQKTKTTAFTQYINQQHELKQPVVIIIKAAQTIPVDSLSQLLQLAKPNTNTNMLFSLVMIGSPELTKLVAKCKVAKLTGNKVGFYRLDPLGLLEIKAFGRMRLAQYKFKEEELFSPQMLATILAKTQGLLKLLDSLFDLVILFSSSDNDITLASFNVGIDFFSRSILPSLLKSKSSSENPLNDPNEQTNKGLVSSLRDKVTRLFSDFTQDTSTKDNQTAQEQLVDDELFLRQFTASKILPSNDQLPQVLVKNLDSLNELTIESKLPHSGFQTIPSQDLVDADDAPSSLSDGYQPGLVGISGHQKDAIKAIPDEHNIQESGNQVDTELMDKHKSHNNQVAENPLLPTVIHAPIQENFMNRSAKLNNVLKSLRDLSPDIEAAAMISEDGLIIASALVLAA
jgi:type II secretory pathway predicted ATPase ExeA